MNNTTALQNAAQLTREELIQLYDKIASNYKQLETMHENDLQTIFETKNILQTSRNNESFLSSELDAITKEHNKEIEELHNRYTAELQKSKINFLTVQESNGFLENEIEILKNEMESLKMSINDQDIKNVSVDYNKSDYIEKLAKADFEVNALNACVAEFQNQLDNALKKIIQNEAVIEDLKDQLVCMEETLQSKKDELEEKNQLYDCTQEKFIELNAALASMKDESETNKRGNSLFAEVDDQRQKMKQQLILQEKYFLQMKKEYNESQYEIRRLRCENATIPKEIDMCRHTFFGADQRYKEHLNERISHLLNENDKLQKTIKWTERKLVETANGKDITWLESMLTFCDNQKRALKEHLHSSLMQKSIAETTLEKSQKDAARWRLEALKSRCIIMNREILLQDNNIAFSETQNVDHLLKKIDIETATPNFENEVKTVLTTSAHKLMVSTDANKENVPHPKDIFQKSEKITSPVKIKSVQPNANKDLLALTINLAKNNSTDVNAKMLLPKNSELKHSDIDNLTKAADISVIKPNTNRNEELKEPDTNYIENEEPELKLLTKYRKMAFTSESMVKLEKNIAKISLTTRKQLNILKPPILDKHSEQEVIAANKKTVQFTAETSNNEVQNKIKPIPKKFVVRHYVIKSKTPTAWDK